MGFGFTDVFRVLDVCVFEKDSRRESKNLKDNNKVILKKLIIRLYPVGCLRKVIALQCWRTNTSYDYKDQCQKHCCRSTNHQLAVVAAELLPSRESSGHRIRHRH